MSWWLTTSASEGVSLVVLIGYLDQRMFGLGVGVQGATCYGRGDCPERFGPL
jgi:hypothetical protein